MSSAPERRRGSDDSGRVTCRVCFARVDLSLDRIDDTPMYVYHRCPACEQWFTIRREDFDRLRANAQAPSGDERGPDTDIEAAAS